MDKWVYILPYVCAMESTEVAAWLIEHDFPYQCSQRELDSPRCVVFYYLGGVKKPPSSAAVDSRALWQLSGDRALFCPQKHSSTCSVTSSHGQYDVAGWPFH